MSEELDYFGDPYDRPVVWIPNHIDPISLDDVLGKIDKTIQSTPEAKHDYILVDDYEVGVWSIKFFNRRETYQYCMSMSITPHDYCMSIMRQQNKQ